MGKNNKGGAMNDFDFEELDKAVNSLATKTQSENNLPKSSTPSPVAVVSAERRQLPVAPREPVVDPPKPDTPSEAQTAVPLGGTSMTPRSATPVVQHAKRLSTVQPKRRGAFMDIVAPSKSGSRHTGTTLQPLSKPEAVQPEKPGSFDDKSASEQRPLQAPDKTIDEQPKPKIEDKAPEIMQQNREPEQEQQPAKSAEQSWPDPLDFHGFAEDAKDKGDKKEPEQENPEPAASSSPFLPEAKVEKRPLGAFSNFTPMNPPEDQPKPQDELTPEADGTFKEPETEAPSVPKEAAEDQKAPTMHDAPHQEKTDNKKPDMHEAAMMSIPKQYHTDSKPADTAKRPVFDTKEYHPPLLEAATGEHRGGGSIWSKLFIALIVLVLLGVAGYFTYLYLTQR